MELVIKKALEKYNGHFGADLNGSAHLWGPVYSVLDFKDGEYITAKGRKPNLDHLSDIVKAVFKGV